MGDGRFLLMSRGLFIPISCIEKCKDKPKEMKALSLYLKMKLRYRNSVMYDYSPNNISTLFNISNYEARVFVGEMIRLKLAKKQTYKKEIRMILTSFKKLKEDSRHVARINVHMKDKLDVVVIKLRHTLLRFNVLNKQQYIRRVYTDLVKLDLHKVSKDCNHRKSIKRMKRLKKLGYDFTNPEKVNIKSCVGYRKAAEVCGLSVASVKPFLQRLKNWGYIKGFSSLVEERPDISVNDLFNMNKYGFNGVEYLFIKNNIVYHHKGTQICL